MQRSQRKSENLRGEQNSLDPIYISYRENMSELNGRVRDFFDQYEQANAEFDVAKIAALYGDVFLFGGPQGVQAVKKEDFVKVLPKRKEFFKAAGLASSRVASVEASALDSKYTLAKVVWKMRFERAGSPLVESDAFTTYVLSASDDSLQIIFQLDHQDLSKKAQELGLK
jgi:hypothetical protein